jgi:hypothetical protein
MSSYPAYDFGVPALLGVWILIGALAASALETRITRERTPDWRDYTALFLLVLFGPLALLALAAWIASQPRSRL